MKKFIRIEEILEIPIESRYCIYCKELIEDGKDHVLSNKQYYHLECYHLINDSNADFEQQ